MRLDHYTIEDLRNVIKFIYSGKLKVNYDKLNRFIRIARELQITGVSGFGIEIDGMERPPISDAMNSPSESDEPGLKDLSEQFKQLSSKPSVKTRKRKFKFSVGSSKFGKTCQFCPYVNPNDRTMYNHQRYCSENPNRTISRCPFCQKEVKPGSMTFHKRTKHGYETKTQSSCKEESSENWILYQLVHIILLPVITS